MITLLTPPSHVIGSSYQKPAEQPVVATPLSSYLAQFPPMRRGKIAAALDRTQGFSGKLMTRRAFAESLAGKPGVRIDYQKERVYLNEQDHFYDFSAVTKTTVDYLAWLMARAAA